MSQGAELLRPEQRGLDFIDAAVENKGKEAPMNIKQFTYDDSNLAYLVWSGDSAAAIDGGAVEEILDFIKREQLHLDYVINTHEHNDHTPGNRALLEATDAVNIPPAELVKKQQLTLGGATIEVVHTPGHTEDSIVFYHGHSLITGDTLFNGTVGNCYTRDYETYFNSLEKVLSFPPETKIFPGHDLFAYAIGIARGIDPENSYMTEYRKIKKRNPLFSTLEEELKVNPFIRFNDSALDAFRETLDRPLNTPFERWRAMMTIH